MKKICKGRVPSQKGNALLLTVILVLTMMVLVGAIVHIAFVQHDISIVQKNTSNTYYLAEAGAQELLDSMNKYLENIPEEVLQELTKKDPMLTKFQRTVFTEDTPKKIKEKVIYKKDSSLGSSEYEGVFLLKDQVVDNFGYIIQKYYTYLKTNYYGTSGTPKEIKQVFKGDREKLGMQTEVTTKVYFSKAPGSWTELPTEYKQENLLTEVEVKLLGEYYAGVSLDSPEIDLLKQKDFCLIVSQAQTRVGSTISDSQKLIVQVKLDNIDKAYYEIQDSYKWADQPTEVLNSALVCFSDVLVTNSSKLVVRGDVSVNGSKANPSNFPEPDENGGIIAADGGKIDVVGPSGTSGNTGSIYCINNVATTKGWCLGPRLNGIAEPTYIVVAGDIIANTVGIYDNYYTGRPDAGVPKIISNNEIKVAGNIFADNDVRIDDYIEESSITIGEDSLSKNGMIFGVSDQDFAPGDATVPDPNKSSGVFNRGKNNTYIKANGAYILGQPFIKFEGDSCYYRQRESIGAPYSESILKDYRIVGEPHQLDRKYLDDRRDEIEKNKVTLRDQARIYAPQEVSVNGSISVGNPNSVTPSDVKKMLYIGWNGINVPSMMSGLVEHNGYNLDYITKQYDPAQDHYYKGLDTSALASKKGIYYKDFGEPPLGSKTRFQGVQAYMTAMRSVFYKGFKGPTTDRILEQTKFNDASTDKDVIDISKLSKLNNDPSTGEHKWRKENPLHVTQSNTVDLKNYKNVPGIIICKSADVELSSSDASTFKGIVICTGNVKIESNVKIEGTLIVAGQLHNDNVREDILANEEAGLVISNGAKLELEHNPDVLFDIKFSDKALQRQVLAVLKLADFSAGDLSAQNIFNLSLKSPSYKVQKIVFKDDIMPQMKHSAINMRISSMKLVKP